MNQDLLRVFETESDYDSAKPDFVYPTVSYVRDVDDVRYMEKTLPILPDYDTTGLATHFVVDEVYANVLPLYQTIYDQYGDTHIDVATSMLEYINENDEDVQIYIGDEPLYQNYLSQLTFAMSNDGESISPTSIYFSNDGLGLKNSNTYRQVIIIREGFGNEVAGQCINNAEA